MTTDLRKWLAFGTGVGIEVRDNELLVTIVRVRPNEVGVLGSATATDFRTRPAAEWGDELGKFLRQVGAGHIAANVLLPRRDVIVRQLHLPGVSDKDLPGAIEFQLDSLHPFADDDVYSTWARIGKTSSILVGIARREVVDGYSSLFAEAGIKVASLTFSAAVVYSALRLITAAPASSFIAIVDRDGETEVYGESESKAVFSATLPVVPERAVALGAAELRLEGQPEPRPFRELLPRPAVFPASHDPDSAEFEQNAFVYAAAVAGACPWLSLENNLLPSAQRRTSSRARLIPTFALGLIAAITTGALLAHSSYADSRYLAILQTQIQRYEPTARKTDAIDRRIAATRARSQSLDDFRRRSKLDMDALGELTRLIPPPGWVSSLDLDRNNMAISGEADQAAVLLKVIDQSPLFERSEFTMPIAQGANGEMFRLRAIRQTPPPPAAPSTPPTTAAPASTAQAAPPPAGAPTK